MPKRKSNCHDQDKNHDDEDELSQSIIHNKKMDFLHLTTKKIRKHIIQLQHIHLLVQQNNLHWIVDASKKNANFVGLTIIQLLQFIVIADDIICLQYIMNEFSRTDVFHYCIRGNAIKCLHWLRPYIKDFEKVSPLHKNLLLEAITHGCKLPIVEFLIDQCKCNVHEIFNKTQTVLSIAFRFATLDVIEYLIKKQNCKILSFTTTTLTNLEKQKLLTWIPDLNNLTLLRDYQTRCAKPESKKMNFFHFQIQSQETILQALQYYLNMDVIKNIVFGYCETNT